MADAVTDCDEPRVVLATATAEDVDTVGVANTLLAKAVAVGFPPLRHVQALDILAGTLDHRAANAGTVCVGLLV